MSPHKKSPHKKSPTAVQPRTAIRLGRGVYVSQATGPTAYLGSLIEVIDSQNRDLLGIHCPPKDVAEVAARLWDQLDAVDPV